MKYILISILYLVIVLIASIAPNPIRGEGINYFFHFMEFSIFSLLIYLTASQYKVKNSFLIAVLTASFFAILVEVLQLFVPVRTSNFFDALSGILGSFLILFFKIKKRRKKK